MKEIILPTELMAFFILNMFGHDSALHDFTTSSELGKGRVLNVLRNVTPTSPGSNSNWSGNGGGGDDELNSATTSLYKNIVYPSLRSCLLSTGFFDITRNDATRSDSFIIVDAKLAMGVVFSSNSVRNMGIAPGFIYLPNKTYSPFEFEVIDKSAIDRSGYARDTIVYKHHADNLTIQINRVGNTFNCSVQRGDEQIIAYNLLSSNQISEQQIANIISINPDVSDAFMSNAINITNYIDYIQLLLDGAESRFTFVLQDYVAFGCGDNQVIQLTKQLLTTTITEFWSRFVKVESLANIDPIFSQLETIQGMFALIYKAILCSVNTAAQLYSCPQPILELNSFYLANKSALEMFVYEYMVSSVNFDTASAQFIAKCNSMIQRINADAIRSVNVIAQNIDQNAVYTRLQKLAPVYGITLPGDITGVDWLTVSQYPATYFANIANPADITEAIKMTMFVNFLQIVVDTFISKQTPEEEVEYVDYKEDSIYRLTDLPIIATNPNSFAAGNLTALITLVQQTFILLFGGDPTSDPDYTKILVDAVGSANVEGVKGVLLQGTSDPFVSDLLQGLFLDLIHRLDSDQSNQLIEYCKRNADKFGNLMEEGGIFAGGAKKKPGYLFDFEDTNRFFLQLVSQNRVTKIKAKVKELVDNTYVLPAFYTNLILQPNIPDATKWTIDFHTIFFGFFANTNSFPQIPSHVVDDLTLEDVLLPNFSLIKMTDILALRENPAKIETINLPSIFIKPDEGPDVFWRFEQGYAYLLKCIVLYNVLFTTGCQTLNVNGFIGTKQAICPNPDDPKFKTFFSLFVSCTTRYIEIVAKINDLIATGSVLSGAQKLCTGYALGSILTSVMTEIQPVISSFKNSALLNIETTEISRILAKKANASTILQNSSFGDNDTKLYNKFISWVNNNHAQRENNTIFSHAENISGSLFDSLTGQDPNWDKQLVRDIQGQYGGDNRKFYINNAVNAPSALGKLDRGYFCPAASIMDNQSTCSTKTSAEANEGFELGIMDFVIHDGRPFGSQVGIPPRMIYRVRVVPNGDMSVCKICAYLAIDGKMLINIADPSVSTSDWPGGANPAIEVPLNKGGVIPMDAKTCLRNIFTTIDSPAFQAYNASGFQSLIDALDKPDTLPLRRLIMESSFVKGLGDFLQEAAGFVENSGYETTPYTNPPFIRAPNKGRLQLNNDRPSSVRAILLVLYGKGAINPNVVAGFMTEMKDKKKIPKSKYAVAGRLEGGGKRTRRKKHNRKTIKHIKKTRSKRFRLRNTRKIMR